MRLLFLALILICVAPVSAWAQANSNVLIVAVPVPDPMNPGSFLPYAPPIEPTIPQVKYLKKDPSATLQQRIDSLIQGIKVDIPPEYDLYGYEIRRYMAHIAPPEIYKDHDRLQLEIKNVRKAKIVFKYWQQDLIKEIDTIGKEIETSQASSQARSIYKFNKGVVQAFLTECSIWLDKNEDLLNYLVTIEGSYTFDEGKFVFATSDDRYAFAAKYEAAIKARNYINGYGPFATMVY